MLVFLAVCLHEFGDYDDSATKIEAYKNISVKGGKDMRKHLQTKDLMTLRLVY